MIVYADNAATTAVKAEALEAMTPYFTEIYGNPSSVHTAGQKAASAVRNARTVIAKLIGCSAREIYFTSGGTESDNWAVAIAAADGERKKKKHIISTVIEHHGILHTLSRYEKLGYRITLLPVNSDGIVSAADMDRAISDDTALVTVMYANNEIGTVQPISELAAICRERGVLFHTDAVQAAGHLPINVTEQKIDMLSISAHKFGGPKGVGALYCKRGIPVSVYINGGAQEYGKRGGTENTASISGMAAALERSCADMEQNNEKVSALRERLVEGITKIERTRYNGHPEHRLDGIANFCFEGIEGEALLLLLDMAGIYASSGSACTSGSLDPSHVLLALGLSHEIAHGSLRISLNEQNTDEEIDYILEKVPAIVEKLRQLSPVWEKIKQGEEE